MKCKKYEAAPKTNDESSKENVHSEKNVSAGMMPNFFQGSSSMQYDLTPHSYPAWATCTLNLTWVIPPFCHFQELFSLGIIEIIGKILILEEADVFIVKI